MAKKLLCIDDSKPPVSKHFDHWITEGEVYTLRAVTGSLVGKQGYLLKEIKNSPVYIHEFAGRIEPSYASDRFVEVDDAMQLVGEEKNTKVKEESLVLN